MYKFILQVLDDVYSRFSHLLTDFDLVWLDKQQFAEAIQACGAPLNTCIGFVDGTTRAIARPSVNQRAMFNGHKRIHCLKFQVNITFTATIIMTLLILIFCCSQCLLLMD